MNVTETIKKLGGTKQRTSSWNSAVAIADEADVAAGYKPGVAYKILVATEDLTSKAGVAYSKGDYMTFEVK